MNLLRSLVASLAAAFLVGLVPAAFAQDPPDPRFTTIDLVVVANSSGVAMGASPAGYDVVARDVNNAPRPGVVVTLDFSESAMRLYALQTPGTTLDCVGRRISRVTNASGAVNFGTIAGGYELANRIGVYVGDELVGSVTGRSTDIDAADGVTGLGDFAHFGTNFLTNPAAAETDFDQGGTTGLGDFALFSSEFLRSTPVGAYCP